MLSIQEYIDGLGEGRVAPQSSRLREFVDGMLQDVRSSYRVREEQLATAVRSYKKNLQRVTETHQALLTAYRCDLCMHEHCAQVSRFLSPDCCSKHLPPSSSLLLLAPCHSHTHVFSFAAANPDVS